MPPHPDEEVHRDEHHLPEEIEEEQIERQEDADDAGEHPQQLEVEEADPILNLGPRGDHRHDAQERGEQHEQQAEAVEAEMEPDAERIDPPDVDIGEPGPRRAVARSRTSDPQRDRDREIDADPGERDPARPAVAPAIGHPGDHAGDERHEDEPDQDHKKMTIVVMTSAPTVRPAAYQRTRPVSVSLSARQAVRAPQASPS